MTEPTTAARKSRREHSAGRLFIGCTITERVRSELQAELRREVLPGRAVPPENWHLTFRFLGETSRDALARLMHELSSQTLGDVANIVFSGYGAFPRIDRAAVLWVGITDGLPAVRTIAANVEAAVQRAGFAGEERPFNAHLTLSRIKPVQDLTEVVARFPTVESRMLVDSVVIFRSHQSGGDVRYESLREWKLGG